MPQLASLDEGGTDSGVIPRQLVTSCRMEENSEAVLPSSPRLSSSAQAGLGGGLVSAGPSTQDRAYAGTQSGAAGHIVVNTDL